MTKKQNDYRLNRNERTPHPFLPIICTFATGLIVSFALFAFAYNWEKTNHRTEFESRAMGYANAVQNSFHNYAESLNSLRDFINNSEQVTRKEFSAFAMSTISRSPAIKAFEWAPLIFHGEREDYVSQARREGFSNFEITERSDSEGLIKAADRPEYVTVFYMDPVETNRPALGYDIASNPIRLQAINRAFATGKMSATERITLVQETEQQFGILILLPIYKQNVPLASKEDRLKYRKVLLWKSSASVTSSKTP